MTSEEIISIVCGDRLLSIGEPEQEDIEMSIISGMCDFGETYYRDGHAADLVPMLQDVFEQIGHRADANAVAVELKVMTSMSETLDFEARSEMNAAIMQAMEQANARCPITGQFAVRQRDIAAGKVEVMGVAYFMRKHWNNLKPASTFQQWVAAQAEKIENIRLTAHKNHALVNQFYNKTPYITHLDMVAQAAYRYGGEVCGSERDVVPLMFSAYYHDSIEDARLSYNDVLKQAKTFMDDKQATMAAEIVYALTNEKGRTRIERANDKYYIGICVTPYAPFVKLCDRMANTSYSFSRSSCKPGMKEKYRAEMPHFIRAISSGSTDKRLSLPSTMVDELMAIVEQ